MRHFLKIFDGIDTLPALLQLHENPQLWDDYPARTWFPESPHHGVSDIWIRYRHRDELNGPETYIEPHVPVWWPAWYKLPALRPIVFALMARCEATQLGGVFITKIAPGGQVKPHSDGHSWHAREYNCKVYVTLASNGRCINTCMDEEIVMGVGTAVTFDNLLTHAVRNDGDTDRLTLIVCMKRET